MWLTEKQLERYTGKKRPHAQKRVLQEAMPPVKFREVNGKLRVPLSQVNMDDAPQSVIEHEPRLHLVR